MKNKNGNLYKKLNILKKKVTEWNIKHGWTVKQ